MTSYAIEAEQLYKKTKRATLVEYFHDIIAINKILTPDKSMLVFQAASAHGHPDMHRPPVPARVASSAASPVRRCNECGKHFTTNFGLKLHLELHKGIYPYHCPYCGRGFAATNNLKGHLVKHTGIKTFVCHICKKAFSYSTPLKDHMKRFHSDSGTR